MARRGSGAERVPGIDRPPAPGLRCPALGRHRVGGCELSTALSVGAAARETPEGVALVHGGQALTWAELAARAEGVATSVRHRLRASPYPLVAVVGGMGVETVTTILALLEDRVPFVLLHPRWSRAERKRALAKTGAALVVEEDGALTAASGSPGRGWIGDGAAAFVFTSGSTGLPRGAALSQAALVASSKAHTAVFGWNEEDRWLLSLPTAHVGGLMIVVRCLLARRSIVLGSRHASGTFDAERVLRVIERHRVTLLSVVPTMLGRLLDGAGEDPPPTLRAVLVGGAAASPALIARARGRGWPVFATYGLTEACSQVATERPGAAEHVVAGKGAVSEAGDSRSGSGVGPPLPGVEVRIESRKTAGEAGTPVRGSILVRGAILFEGYVGSEPGAPLERPFDADGWFDTGDLGNLDASGQLHILGRRSDRILTGGENVDPSEVEAAVLEWPGAVAACVVGVDDDEWGERVGAVVVGSRAFEAERGLAGLERHLRERLAGFKRPRRWRVVDHLPVAPSGKVDRQACRGLLIDSERPGSPEARR
ncbi:MAG: class I adenylate-forming enzyme family protein [Acidobacteria bacterium]|nr:class I adenylate-forming enzyme family protein [Acidobacteriota bacterium]